MALTVRAAFVALAGLFAAASSAAPVAAGPVTAAQFAQQQPTQDQPDAEAPALPDKAPAPFAPDAGTPSTATLAADTWIFSGELQGSHEQFSGTLVASKTEAQFEMKLAGGATCDGSDLQGDIGLVRLPEITCTDDRTMRALFVPQAGNELRVFGHVGEERFVSSAHLLGSEAVPEKGQTAAPPGDPPAAPAAPDAPK